MRRSVRQNRDSSFKASIHSFTHSFERGGRREWDEPGYPLSGVYLHEGEGGR